jgi:hypothetical protein
MTLAVSAHRQVGPAVVCVVEHHDRLPSGGVPGDLDGVLHRLGAELNSAERFSKPPGVSAAQFLADRDVLLVRSDHEARVSEPLDLGPDRLDHRGAALPMLVTAMPEPKSIHCRPSTSVSVPPEAWST